MMARAWKVPSFGQEICNTISNILRKNGGLDLLIDQCARQDHDELQFSSAKLLQYCILLSENRGYVVDKGLDKVVSVAKKYTQPLMSLPIPQHYHIFQVSLKIDLRSQNLKSYSYFLIKLVESSQSKKWVKIRNAHFI